MSRQSNFELLRIVSMLFIVIHHVIVHIFNLADLGDEEYTPVTEAIAGGGVFY